MSFTFADAQPIKTEGTGRTAEPNPFLEIVQEIALKTDPETGKPVAKAFTVEHKDTAEDRKSVIAKIKRQFSAAGEKSDPKVTVVSKDAPVQESIKGGAKGATVDSATKTLITFWTVKRQNRPRKPAETATASTPQTNAAATPAA